MFEIIRFYEREDLPIQLIGTFKTLEQAQTYCRAHDTKSCTCSSAEGMTRTSNFGPWFDGYREV